MKYYIWDDLYLFKNHPDGINGRCVIGKEIQDILKHCHGEQKGGHHGLGYTTRKVLVVGLYWQSIFNDDQ